MFTYCENNPINLSDHNGYCAVPSAYASNPALWYSKDYSRGNCVCHSNYHTGLRDRIKDLAESGSGGPDGGARIQASKDILIDITGTENLLDEAVRFLGLKGVSDIFTSVAVRKYRESHKGDYPIYTDDCMSNEIGWHIQGYLSETVEGYDSPKLAWAYKILHGGDNFKDRCSIINIKKSDFTYGLLIPVISDSFWQFTIFDYKNGLRK